MLAPRAQASRERAIEYFPGEVGSRLATCYAVARCGERMAEDLRRSFSSMSGRTGSRLGSLPPGPSA